MILFALSADAYADCSKDGSLEPQLPKEVNEITCKALDPRPDEIKKILEKALKPYIRTTTRKIYFYHYGWRTKRDPKDVRPGEWDSSMAIPSSNDPNNLSGPVDPKADGLAETYFRRQAAGQFEATFPTNEFGYGLYSATEPLASISYSGNPGQLLRIGVPAGVNFLDLREIHREIPSNEVDDLYVTCFELNQCENDWCRERTIGFTNERRRKGQFKTDPKGFLYSKEGRKVLSEVTDTFAIEFYAGSYGPYQFPECKLNSESHFMTDAVFIRPESSKKMELDFLVPALEKTASESKRQLYVEVLQYFDSFDFEQKEETIFRDGRDKSIQRFWQYYEAWAPVIHNLPQGTDLIAFQKAQSQKWAAKRHKELTSQLFGCSLDPKHKDEAFPPK